jgi:hypothetical protein
VAAPEDDPWSALEREAAGHLDGPAGERDNDVDREEVEQLLEVLRSSDDFADLDPGHRLVKLLRQRLNGSMKREKEAEERGFERGRAETAAAIQREALFAQHAVPTRLRNAFADIAPGDADAFAQRVSELAADGIVWRRPDGASPAGEPAQPGQPGAPEAPPPNPAAAVALLQQAAAAGGPVDRDVLSRVASGGIAAIQGGQDAAGFEAQLNAQIAALGQQRSAGIMG